MDPHQLLSDSRRELDEGMRALADLEHRCLELSATASAPILKQVHEVRSKLEVIRGRLDLLASTSGARTSSSQELRQSLEPVIERIQRTVERIHRLRRQIESASPGGTGFGLRPAPPPPGRR